MMKEFTPEFRSKEEVSIEEEKTGEEYIEALSTAYRNYLNLDKKQARRDSPEQAVFTQQILDLINELGDHLELGSDEVYTNHMEDSFSANYRRNTREFRKRLSGAELIMKDGVLRLTTRASYAESLKNVFADIFKMPGLRRSYGSYPEVGVILEPANPKKGAELIQQLKDALSERNKDLVVDVLTQIRDLVKTRTLLYRDMANGPAQKGSLGERGFLASMGTGTGGQRLRVRDGELIFPAQGENLSRELQEGFKEVFGDLVEGDFDTPYRSYGGPILRIPLEVDTNFDV